MASNYPGSLDSFDTIASDKKTSDSVGGRTHRAMHNDLGDAIESVQTELGTTPSGSESTVAARLTAIESGARMGTGSIGATALADNAVDTAAIQDGAVTAAKLARQPGNLLSENVASGTDYSADTTGFNAYSVTLASSTSYASQGSRSLQVTTTSTGGCGPVAGGTGVTSGTIPVTGGETYTFTADVMAPSVTELVKVVVFWWTSAGNVAASTASNETAQVALSTSWQTLRATAVAPANAAYASIYVRRASGASGSVFHVDRLGLWRGAAGTWSLPGVPVTGQSEIAVNGAVNLSGTGTPEGVVTAAPGSTWLQTDSTTDVKGWIRWIKATGTGNTGWVAGPEADTGWRDVTSLLANGWAGGYVYLRRIGRNVEFDMSALSAASATSGVPFTLPAGFRIGAPNASWRGLVYKTDLTLRRTATDTVSGQFTITGYAAGDSLYGTGLGLTADSWPTSLPGSAA